MGVIIRLYHILIIGGANSRWRTSIETDRSLPNLTTSMMSFMKTSATIDTAIVIGIAETEHPTSTLIPKLVQELGADKLGGKHSDHAEDKDPIEFEILVDELALLPLGLERDGFGASPRAPEDGAARALEHHARRHVQRLKVVEHVQATVDVAAPRSWQHARDPLSQCVAVGEEEQQEPEPEEREDLLVV